MNDIERHDSFARTAMRQFAHRKLGMAALLLLALFVLVGVYAPFLASSKPLFVNYNDTWYFPLFRYLFYRGFFTSRLDLFFNLMIFTLPLFIAALWLPRQWRRYGMAGVVVAQLLLFLFVAFRQPQDPDFDSALAQSRQQAAQRAQANANSNNNPLLVPKALLPSWSFELQYMNPYGRLNTVVRNHERFEEYKRLEPYEQEYHELVRGRGQGEVSIFPTLWQQEQEHELRQIASLSQILSSDVAKYRQAIEYKQKVLETCKTGNRSVPECGDLDQMPLDVRTKVIEVSSTIRSYEEARAQLKYIKDRRRWLIDQDAKLSFIVMPLIRPYHWEDDAGGDQALNHYVPWYDLTRTDRKDLTAALIFGVRISIVVGLSAVALALLIGVPFGCLAGYYAGTLDIILCRLMEIWEAMPTFFMLLLVVAVTQSKSIFLVIAIIGFFGWTGFSRYIRGEFFKQRNLPYVEACRAQGFSDSYIIFRHVLPNSIPPILTLLPFAIMGAISTEAGLSFLGLGEEGSCSWGVLMDEGRRAFPGESYLLWPPAILLTVLLVAIALVGDALRDAIDPRLRRS